MMKYPLVAEEYIIGEKIGKGSFADVYHSIVKKTRQDIAIKLIDLEENGQTMDSLQQETNLMLTLHHENLTNMYCSFIDDHFLWIVMPWLEAGSCATILNKIAPHGFKDEKILATILKSVLHGVKYLHNNNKIHRDIKPGNILIARDGGIQLSDFGISANLDMGRPKHHTFTGTMNFMAPEVIDPDVGYDESADIWSIGITALELAYGRSPYKRMTPLQVMKTIISGPPPSCETFNDHSQVFSDKFKSFIDKCLQKNPKDRAHINDLLNHKFIKQAQNKDYIKQEIIQKLKLETMPTLKRIESYDNIKQGKSSNLQLYDSSSDSDHIDFPDFEYAL